MKNIVFIDTEVDVKSKKILDIGCVTANIEQFHSSSTIEFIDFLKHSDFICGHNIIKHDLPYFEKFSGLDVFFWTQSY